MELPLPGYPSDFEEEEEEEEGGKEEGKTERKKAAGIRLSVYYLVFLSLQNWPQAVYFCNTGISA